MFWKRCDWKDSRKDNLFDNIFSQGLINFVFTFQSSFSVSFRFQCSSCEKTLKGSNYLHEITPAPLQHFQRVMIFYHQHLLAYFALLSCIFSNFSFVGGGRDTFHFSSSSWVPVISVSLSAYLHTTAFPVFVFSHLSLHLFKVISVCEWCVILSAMTAKL